MSDEGYPRYYQFLNTDELWRVEAPGARPEWRRSAGSRWVESFSPTEEALLRQQGDTIHRYYGEVQAS